MVNTIAVIDRMSYNPSTAAQCRDEQKPIWRIAQPRETLFLQNLKIIVIYPFKFALMLITHFVLILQLLRRLLDDKIICTLQKPFEWRSVEGLSVVSAMNLSEYASVDDRGLHPRLMVSLAIYYILLLRVKDLEANWRRYLR